jgi:hypothetical protein
MTLLSLVEKFNDKYGLLKTRIVKEYFKHMKKLDENTND